MLVCFIFLYLNVASSFEKSFVRQAYMQETLSFAELSYYKSWDCFDPYGLSGLDQNVLRKVYISPASLGHDQALGCLNITERHEILPVVKIPSVSWIQAKRIAYPEMGCVKAISSPDFYRFGSRLCFRASCVGVDCKDSFHSRGAVVYCADSGLYVYSARWTIGGYFGYISILNSLGLSRDSSSRVAQTVERGRDLDGLKGVSSFEFNPRSQWGSSLYGYDARFDYSFDSVRQIAGELDGREIKNVMFEVRDGKGFGLRQRYYNISSATSLWAKLSRAVFVNPLGGGAGYRWQDLQHERIVVDNVVALKDASRDFSGHYWSHFYRYLSPLRRDDSVCIGYHLGAESRDLQLICVGKDQQSVEHKFRNITIKITKF